MNRISFVVWLSLLLATIILVVLVLVVGSLYWGLDDQLLRILWLLSIYALCNWVWLGVMVGWKLKSRPRWRWTVYVQVSVALMFALVVTCLAIVPLVPHGAGTWPPIVAGAFFLVGLFACYIFAKR